MNTDTPVCISVGSVEMAGDTAVFDLEILDGGTMKLAFDLDALPDLAMGVAAVLHAARTGVIEQ